MGTRWRDPELACGQRAMHRHVGEHAHRSSARACNCNRSTVAHTQPRSRINPRRGYQCRRTGNLTDARPRKSRMRKERKNEQKGERGRSMRIEGERIEREERGTTKEGLVQWQRILTRILSAVDENLSRHEASQKLVLDT